MLILNAPALASRILDPAIRGLVNQRFSEICAGEPNDYDRHGYMIVVEPGDSVAALEEEICYPILHLDGEPDFTPCFEALEEHARCYEMIFIFNDEGFCIAIFIPKHPGIDAELLAMCAEYAAPAALTHP